MQSAGILISDPIRSKGSADSVNMSAYITQLIDSCARGGRVLQFFSVQFIYFTNSKIYNAIYNQNILQSVENITHTQEKY